MSNVVHRTATAKAVRSRRTASSVRPTADEVERIQASAEAIVIDLMAVGQDEAIILRREDLGRLLETMRSAHQGARHIIEATSHASGRPDMLSTGEAAAELDVSINTVKKWVRLGLLRDPSMAGSHLRIPRSEVERVARLNRVLAETSGLGSDQVDIERGEPGRLPWQR